MLGRVRGPVLPRVVLGPGTLRLHIGSEVGGGASSSPMAPPDSRIAGVGCSRSYHVLKGVWGLQGLPRGSLRMFLGAWCPWTECGEEPGGSKAGQLLEDAKTLGGVAAAPARPRPTGCNPPAEISSRVTPDHPTDSPAFCIFCSISTQWDWYDYSDRAPKGICSLWLQDMSEVSTGVCGSQRDACERCSWVKKKLPHLVAEFPDEEDRLGSI